MAGPPSPPRIARRRVAPSAGSSALAACLARPPRSLLCRGGGLTPFPRMESGRGKAPLFSRPSFAGFETCLGIGAAGNEARKINFLHPLHVCISRLTILPLPQFIACRHKRRKVSRRFSSPRAPYCSLANQNTEEGVHFGGMNHLIHLTKFRFTTKTTRSCTTLRCAHRFGPPLEICDYDRHLRSKRSLNFSISSVRR